MHISAISYSIKMTSTKTEIIIKIEKKEILSKMLLC